LRPGAPTAPVGGRLQLFTDRWQELDQWAAGIVAKGLKLEMDVEPAGSGPREFRGEKEKEKIVEKTHHEFLEKAVVEPVPPGDLGGHYSLLFPVPKKGGKWRGILDLRQLNDQLAKEHFKMEGLHTVRETLRRGDWMTSLDLQDAYNHVPIHHESRRFFRYIHRGQHFQFRAMPFGLTSAPRIFTKIMRPVVRALREKGIRCVIYLDDLLIIAETREKANEHTREARRFLESLGWTINYAKSELTPTRTITYLGFAIDSGAMSLYVPAQKIKDIRRDITSCLEAVGARRLTLRQLAGVLGKITATSGAISITRLLTRQLLREKNQLLHRHSWDQVVWISESAQEELRSWLAYLEDYNGREIIMGPPEVTITTDASPWGWGAVDSLGNRIQAFWSEYWAQQHNNVQELKAIALAVKGLANGSRWKRVAIKTDNLTAMAYINNQGGRFHNLSEIAQQLWAWALSKGIQLQASYIPGKENVTADQLSRIRRHDRSDWSLNQSQFRKLENRWGPHTVDLFARSENAQLPRYCSLVPDPRACASDGLNLRDLRNENAYAFPPFALIPRLLRRIQEEEARVTLVAPAWPTQAWWPTLQGMLTAKPIRLQGTPVTFLHQTDMDPSTWRLTAFRLSGRRRRSEAYRKRHSD